MGGAARGKLRYREQFARLLPTGLQVDRLGYVVSLDIPDTQLASIIAAPAPSITCGLFHAAGVAASRSNDRERAQSSNERGRRRPDQAFAEYTGIPHLAVLVAAPAVGTIILTDCTSV